MDYLDLFGHLAYISMIIGHVFVTKKEAKGFVFRIVGGIIWMVIGGFLNMSSIIVWSGIFAAVDIYGFFGWVNNKEKIDENK